MLPLANILLLPLARPLPHGAVGWLDEILNLVPLVFGSGLLIYLYLGARKRRAADAQQRAAGDNPPAPTDEQPRT